MKHIVVTCILDGQNELIKRCVESVKNQDVQKEHRVFIDGCKNSFKPIDIEVHSVMMSYERKGALDGIVSMLQRRVSDEDIIHIVDGDDQLLPGALEHRERIFSACPNIMVCWGGYRYEGNSRAKFARPWDGKEPRKIPWGFSHLKSFRYKIFKFIHTEYFKRNGRYFMTCADLALMYPLMELAGKDRCLCDKGQALYLYNDLNPLNDHKIHKKEQIEDEKYIRSMYPLQRMVKI